MPAPFPIVDDRAVCDVDIRTEYGWQRSQHGDVTVWFKGWIHGCDGQTLAARFARAAPTAIDIDALLKKAVGHFALVARGRGWMVAAADWVRSIPLATALIDGRWTVDDQAERLRRRAGLGPEDIEPEAALAVAMAGYTIDTSTLYRNLELLGPGEFFCIEGGRRPERHRYYTYQPWHVQAAAPATLQRELNELTLHIVERMLQSLNGRMLIIPLSAGRDSRLIASAARHLGYTNIRCFTYGRAGNFEAQASKAIAEKLGYRWTFVPATIAKQRRFFESGDYARYLDFADSGCSVPFVQDMAPLMELKASGYIPGDAVIVNGNSGDYISGNHIPEALQQPAAGLGHDARWKRILDALMKKHFWLWEGLSTESNRRRIESLLREAIERAGGKLDDPDTDHGLYEYSEFQDRQCKYVITGQRIYEFLGHDWRLPLWDNDYLQFWERAPLGQKVGQNLYARMLTDANWGGVWQGVPVNRKTVRPLSLIPIRLIAKALHAPLGRESWHRFERRFLQYWMDPTCAAACVPYSRVTRDKRGARHHIAWLAEIFLARHGVTLNSLAN